MRIFILLVLASTFCVNVYAKSCPEGSYLVQGHPRQAYYRSDGTHVSATTVSSSCRNYRDDGPLAQKFLKKAPREWPHKKEKFKKSQVSLSHLPIKNKRRQTFSRHIQVITGVYANNEESWVL